MIEGQASPNWERGGGGDGGGGGGGGENILNYIHENHRVVH